MMQEFLVTINQWVAGEAVIAAVPFRAKAEAAE